MSSTLWISIVAGLCVGCVVVGCVVKEPAPGPNKPKLAVTKESALSHNEEAQVMVLVNEKVDFEAIEKIAPILHRASQRVFVVRVFLGQLASLTKVRGVVAVTDGDFPKEFQDQLSTSEAVFAAAFSARKAKNRTGDGLEWDAHGFEPPDSPPET